MTKRKILAISGSTRKNSSNETILKAFVELYPEQLQVEMFDGIDKLPHFNPDLDKDNLPVEVAAFRKGIAAADGVIICTPEYVCSLPGALKNAIEWNVSTTLFSNKPVALIIAAASGEKALESLVLIMKTIESRIANQSILLIQGVKGKVKGGEINKEVLSQLRILGDSFIKTIDEAIREKILT